MGIKRAFNQEHINQVWCGDITYGWQFRYTIRHEGSQYCSHKFKVLMFDYEIAHSMSAPGTPTYNAVIESFFNKLKKDLVYPNKVKTKAQIKMLIT